MEKFFIFFREEKKKKNLTSADLKSPAITLKKQGGTTIAAFFGVSCFSSANTL